MLTADSLAAEPRWDLVRLAALPGRCRGDLLGPWGQNVAKRFGASALARVRGRLPASLATIAEVMTARDWLPVHAQIVVTEAIVDELLAGDLRALYPLIVEDTRAGVGRVQQLAVRAMGAGRAFRLTAGTFAKVYDRGTADVEVAAGHGQRRARQVFRGSPLFANPTWRALQLFAMRTLLELAGTPGEAIGEVGERGEPDSFAAVATW